MRLLRDGRITPDFFISVLNFEEKELSEVAQKRVDYSLHSLRHRQMQSSLPSLR